MKKRMRKSFSRSWFIAFVLLSGIYALTDAASLLIYSDSGSLLGSSVYTWRGGGSPPYLATFDGSYLGGTSIDPTYCFQTYSNDDNYAGWGIFKNMDLSAYNGGKLKFWVKAFSDVKIEIKDSTTHTRYISQYDSYFDAGTWKEITIPLSDFGANLSAITGLFMATVETWDKYFYIDYVQWLPYDVTPPGAPVLQSPSEGSTTTSQKPVFDWSDVADDSGVKYQIQVDSHGAGFPSLEINVSDIYSSQYTPSFNLSLGNYWWRVQATDGSGNVGVWSSTVSFTIAAVDTSSPAVPSPISPSNGSSTYDTTPMFEWTQSFDPSGVSYRLQIDDESSFASPLTRDITNINLNKYSISPPLSSDKTYYWRVKAIDGAGNQSDYSTTSVVTISSTSWTTFNVLNDQGAAGYVGTYTGNGGVISFFNLDYSTYTEGNRSQRTDFSIAPTQWAGWYVEEGAAGGTETRYMVTYSSGYLCFSVKASTDIEVGIRSNNVAAGNEQSKVLLNRDLGVLLNNQWQEVSIPVSSFTALDSNLDLSTMTVYFNAAMVGSKIGAASGSYWIDNVRWMSPGSVSPDAQKVLTGLKNKQSPTTGFVRSFETIDRAVTYDQALAVMAFCFYGDISSAEKVLNAYVYMGFIGSGGYADEYKVDTYEVALAKRTTGPNLWMLQAFMYYKHITGNTSYDSVMNSLASWLANMQDSDGGLMFGYDGSSLLSYKGTEHNLTGYAVFKNYAQIKGDSSYNIRASSVALWLNTMWGNWNSEASKRFKVGPSSPEIDKALDCYSIAVLAFPQGTYNECFANVDSYFKVTKTCDLTGAPVEGYDFGANTNLEPDKDSVWLEGTGQMAVAYYVKGAITEWGHFTDEIEKAIAPMGSNGQGITYATNQGTAYYGWLMDSTHQCISSAVWYLFAKNKFNPFYPFPRFQATIHNVLDNSATDYISWSPPALPCDWKTAGQYIKIEVEPNLSQWGIQIYTDNAASDANPKYTGSTITANCAGLIDTVLTSKRIPLCWRLTDNTTNSITIVQGSDNKLYSTELGGQSSNFPCFLWMKDIKTPDIPGENTTRFIDSEDYVTVKEGMRGAHYSEGEWAALQSPDYIYIGAKFASALTPREYKTNKLTLEFFRE